MAAQHPLHLRVADDHRGQRLGAVAGDGVRVADAGGAGRVVHEHHRGPLRRLGQPRLEPVATGGVDPGRAVRPGLVQRIETDQPDPRKAPIT